MEIIISNQIESYQIVYKNHQAFYKIIVNS